MITGFNTDIDFQGVTYHVQTEDKGLATPFILSLVYNRGTILASKRSPYEDLVEVGFDEKILNERLHKQHKLICAAIRAGKIEQLKEMTAKDSAKRKESSPKEKTSKNHKSTVSAKDRNEAKTEQKINEISAPETEIEAALPVQAIQNSPEPIAVQTISNGANKVSFYQREDSPIPKPKFDFSITSITANIETAPQAAKAKTASSSTEEELVIEAIEIIEDEYVLADEAVEIVAETADSKDAANKMSLQIIGDQSFKSGEKKTMTILVHRGDQQKGLSGAQVMVKVLGAAFRPLIFHGKTDKEGIAKVHLQMPLFKQGRAAILIKAMSEGEEIELRRTIKHR